MNNLSETPRTSTLHKSLPMEGQDGLAYAYNTMKLHAELLEREANFLQAKLWRAKKMVAYPLRVE